jgi:Trypsin-like peptidase domain
MFTKKVILTLAVAIITFAGHVRAQKLEAAQITDKLSNSVASVLAGNEKGELVNVGYALVVGSNGLLAAPYYLVKDAKQVQVRLRNGDIYDNVKLLGVDERRGVAGLKIQAAGLAVPAMSDTDDIKQGDAIFALTGSYGMGLQAVPGSSSGLRLAEEVTTAGRGFRVIQFTAPTSSASNGGILADSQGRVAGLIVSPPGGPYAKYAVPVNNLLGLAGSGTTMSFGSGAGLDFPGVNTNGVGSAATTFAGVAKKETSKDPRELFLKSKTVFVESHTSLFKPSHLINRLIDRPQIKQWGWVFVSGDSWEDEKKADMVITLNHQALTWDFLWTLRHRETGIVIAAGKVIIWGGPTDAGIMADDVIKKINIALQATPNVRY